MYRFLSHSEFYHKTCSRGRKAKLSSDLFLFTSSTAPISSVPVATQGTPEFRVDWSFIYILFPGDLNLSHSLFCDIKINIPALSAPGTS